MTFCSIDFKTFLDLCMLLISFLCSLQPLSFQGTSFSSIYFLKMKPEPVKTPVPAIHPSEHAGSPPSVRVF